MKCQRRLHAPSLSGTDRIGFDCGSVSELEHDGVWDDMLVFHPPLILNVVGWLFSLLDL